MEITGTKRERGQRETVSHQWRLLAGFLLLGGLVAFAFVKTQHQRIAHRGRKTVTQKQKETARGSHTDHETEVVHEEVHPLELVRKKKSVLPVRGFLDPTNKKRQRNGNQKEIASSSLRLEDYDMTNEFPYDEVKVLRVAADGDCFFHCARQVLGDLGIQVTTKDLRAIVARSISEREFTVLKSIYTMAEKERERELLLDYSFMKNVDSVAGLRRSIMTKEYFGDEMALRALEKAYPVKFMIIRLQPNDKIDLSRRFSEEEINEKPWFALLLLNVGSVHYELISYQNKVVLKREELPLKIQRLMGQLERESHKRKTQEQRQQRKEKPATRLHELKGSRPVRG